MSEEQVNEQLNFFKARDFCLPLGKRTYIMGILNVTPDSFSDGGLYDSTESAVARALDMQTQGADILDIGAQSTRPGAQYVSPQKEIKRLAGVFDALHGRLSVPISVDTFSPEVAAFALKNGACIINDVSGTVNPAMASVVKAADAGWIIMHNDGGASTIDVPYEGGVLKAVRNFFEQALLQTDALGIERSHFCFDPGIGFGKSHQDNLDLLRHINNIKIEDLALLTGASRKRVVGFATLEEDATMREPGTIAAHTAAIAGGTDIIRVHDVRQGLQGAKMADALYRTL